MIIKHLKTKSLKKRIQRSYLVIIAIMVIPTVYSVIVSNIHSKRYDDIITNVSKAKHINEIASSKIPEEIWNIVAGRLSFTKGRQYKYITELIDGIDEMLVTTESSENRQKLQVAKRTCQTLTHNVDELGNLIQNNSSVKQNMEKMEDIRSITSLLSDILQDFIIAEIESASETNKKIKSANVILTVIQFTITLSSILVALYGFISTIKAIQKPIKDMESLSTKIAQGDFEAKIEETQVEELKQLSANLNALGTKIQNLMEQNTRKQKNLQKAELKLLQAQITPHFLYNTFDTIIWLAEEDENEEVIKITKAFSDYLRTTLSKGHEWITIEQEVNHVANYLTIQKVRYGSILNYSIDFDSEVKDFFVLKLSLQPLIENAIYHGIKNKRGRGNISVKVHYADAAKNYITFEVKDDGIGFSEEKLKQVQSELNDCTDSEDLKYIYGLYNVNKRLKLYFNESSNGLNIESTYGQGTLIYFTIPCTLKKGESYV